MSKLICGLCLKSEVKNNNICRPCQEKEREKTRNYAKTYWKKLINKLRCLK